jgi:quinol monooxygenase YgiN
MIHVIAMITAQPGQRSKILEVFNTITGAVHAEPGCLEYTATVDAQGMPPSTGSVGSDTFVVVEKWASLAALQAHGVAPHMQAFSAQVKDWLVSVVVHVLEPVA